MDVNKIDIEKRVKEVIGDQLGVSERDISSDTNIQDLCADSLDELELIMAIEDEFSIDIPDEDVKHDMTLQQIVDYLATQSID